MLIRFKICFVVVVVIIFSSMPVFARGSYTKIDGTTLYSEYYPNPDAKFKGTIVFENGSGETLKEWMAKKSFFQCVKNYGNLFLYDRSGLGKSPPDFNMSPSRPMTAKLINDKLIKLLRKRGVKPPYILVAHSYGGLYAGYFARKFPKLVKGLLLVDPVPSDYKWTQNFLNRYNHQVDKFSKLSSREFYQQYKKAIYQYKSIVTPELLYQLLGFEKSIKQVKHLSAMSNKFPIIIISSSYMEKNAPIMGDWYKQQQQWLNNNPNSKIVKIHSSHWIQLDHPKFVCSELQQLVDIVVDS